MKKIFFGFFIAIVLLSQSLYGQITNSWLGVLEFKGAKFEIVLHIKQAGEGIYTKMDIPAQNVIGLAAESSTYTNGLYTADFTAALIKIEGYINEDGLLDAHFLQGGYDIPIKFKVENDFNAVPRLKKAQDPQEPFDYTIKEVQFKNEKDNVSLAGTLTLPKNIDNPPIAIMISGSGQQNRDSELFGHKPFWIIADDFAKKGIGVLRYDDRGMGNSEAGPDLNAKTTGDFALDAEAALDYLISLGYSKIGFIGHSEGGYIAPLIAKNRKKDVKFVIMMAGLGIPGDSLLAIQTYYSSIAEGIPDSIANYNRRFTRTMAKFVKSYKGNKLPTALENKIIAYLDKDTVSQSISEEERTTIVNNTVWNMSSPYIQYFVRADPYPILKKVKCPVLALNGTKDVQVPAAENLSRIEKALKKGRNKNYEIVYLAGLNHLFQPASTGAISEYATISMSIDPEVLNIMSKWILDLKLK